MGSTEKIWSHVEEDSLSTRVPVRSEWGVEEDEPA